MEKIYSLYFLNYLPDGGTQTLSIEKDKVSHLLLQTLNTQKIVFKIQLNVCYKKCSYKLFVDEVSAHLMTFFGFHFVMNSLFMNSGVFFPNAQKWFFLDP